MSSKPPWVILFAFALVIAACGGDDGGTDATPLSSDQTSGDVNTDGGGDGNGSTPGAGFTSDDARADAVGAGEDFPIPIPGGWVIDSLAALEEQGASFSGGVQLFYTTDDLEEVIAFYDEWTDAQPDEYSRTESSEIVVYSKASPLAQISISKDFEYQDELWTALTISAASE